MKYDVVLQISQSNQDENDLLKNIDLNIRIKLVWSRTFQYPLSYSDIIF